MRYRLDHGGWLQRPHGAVRGCAVPVVGAPLARGAQCASLHARMCACPSLFACARTRARRCARAVVRACVTVFMCM